MLVKQRSRNGEFGADIALELGFDYQNFCKFCRRKNYIVHTKASLRANYTKHGLTKRIGRPLGFRIGNNPLYHKIVKAIRKNLTAKKISEKYQVTTQYIYRVKGLLGRET